VDDGVLAEGEAPSEDVLIKQSGLEVWAMDVGLGWVEDTFMVISSVFSTAGTILNSISIREGKWTIQCTKFLKGRARHPS
jgi:hypothetical protein